MSLLDWDNDGKIEPHEVGGTMWAAGAVTNITDEMNSSDQGGQSPYNPYDYGGADEGGASCGCILAVLLFPGLLILLLFLL